MKKVFVLFLSFLFIHVSLWAQKAPLDDKAYDGWKSVGSESVSEDGEWGTYTITPQQGDGWLYFLLDEIWHFSE